MVTVAKPKEYNTVKLVMGKLVDFEGAKAYQKNMDGALLIITHSTRILEALSVDKTHVIVNGKIKATGDGSLVNKINDEGFESFLEG